MSKAKDCETLYAVRDKNTKKIVRNTRCKGGSYYKQRPLCQKRCIDFNNAHKMSGLNDEYEVGEYAVIDIDRYKELFKEEETYDLRNR